MTAPDINAKIPAATCDDDPQPATVEVMANAGELDGILLAVAVPGTAYEAVQLTPDATQRLMSALSDAVTHLAATEPLDPTARPGIQTEHDRPTERCTADPAAIRAWLNSPSTEAQHEGLTVAQLWDIDEFFSIDDPDVNLHLANLFEQSSAAGVFGVPGHQVELWHVADNEGSLDGHLIVLRQPDDTGLASGHIPVDLLIDPDLTGVDAAVSTLENAAVTVNELLAAGVPAAAQPGVTASVAARGLDQPAQPAAARAFPALDVAAGAAGPTVAAVAGSAATAQVPHRRSR